MIIVKKEEKVYIEWQKRFVNGEQNIEINMFGEIVECYKNYYWQKNSVYNFLYQFVSNAIKNGCPSDVLYGKGKILDTLIPLQIRYNKAENQLEEACDRLAKGVMFVEDGSLDIDELSEEGLAPGKVVVYRQGSNCPVILQDKLTENIECLLTIRNLYRNELKWAIEETENNLILMKYN